MGRLYKQHFEACCHNCVHYKTSIKPKDSHSIGITRHCVARKKILESGYCFCVKWEYKFGFGKRKMTTIHQIFILNDAENKLDKIKFSSYHKDERKRHVGEVQKL